MSQRLSDAYVRIIDEKFIPMDMPVGYVYQCIGHVADYMVDNGSAVHTDSEGNEPAPTVVENDK